MRFLYRVPLLLVMSLLVLQIVSAQSSNIFFNQTFTIPANGKICYYDIAEYVYDSAGSTVLGTVTVSGGYVDFVILSFEPSPQHGPAENGCRSLEPSYGELYAGNLSPLVAPYSFTYNVPDNGNHYFVFYNTQSTQATVTMVLSWASSPTTQQAYTPYTPTTYAPYTYQTSSQMVAMGAVDEWAVFGPLLWIIAITLVAFVAYYFLYLPKRTKQVRQTKLDAVLTSKPTTPAETATEVEPRPSPTDIMFCKECGARIARDSKFCKECGSKQS